MLIFNAPVPVRRTAIVNTEKDASVVVPRLMPVLTSEHFSTQLKALFSAQWIFPFRARRRETTRSQHEKSNPQITTDPTANITAPTSQYRAEFPYRAKAPRLPRAEAASLPANRIASVAVPRLLFALSSERFPAYSGFFHFGQG